METHHSVTRSILLMSGDSTQSGNSPHKLPVDSSHRIEDQGEYDCLLALGQSVE